MKAYLSSKTKENFLIKTIAVLMLVVCFGFSFVCGASAARDFKVQSVGGTPFFFIEGDNGRVGISTISPGYKLDVLTPYLPLEDDSSFIRIQRDNADFQQVGLTIYDTISTALWSMYTDSGSSDFLFEGGNVPDVIFNIGADNRYFGLGIGTSTPDTLLTIANDNWISAKDNAGTSYVNMFKVNASDEIDVGATLNVGPIELEEDSGAITLVNLPVSSTPSDGDVESYGLSIDSNPILTIYGLADGTGGTDTHRVGIGTTTPSATLDIWGDLSSDEGNITTDNLGNITAESYYDGVYYLDPDRTDGFGLVIADSIQVNGVNPDRDNYFAGNVGIITDDPSSALEVNGDIELTNLYDNDKTNFFDGSCDYGIKSISSTGLATCSPQQGTMSSWTIQGDEETPSTVENGQLVKIIGSSTIDTSESSRIVEVSVQADSIDGNQLADTIILDSTLGITQSNFDVNFDVNTLFIDGSENSVGIGTTTIGANKLKVEGNIYSTNLVDTDTLRVRDGAYPGYVLTDGDGSGTAVWTDVSGGADNDWVIVNPNYIYNYDSLNRSVGIGTTNPGTAKLAVMDGNVGIGTINPGTYKLNIWGDLSSDEGKITTDNSGNITAEVLLTELIQFTS